LAPRMPGTEYEHLHQGTDIFAPAGTSLLACERGVITKMGTDVLGGIKLWLVGESGARYYYAHLTAFADDIEEGDVVEAGTVVGFVGNTGNAVGTPSHLHFEIHPGAGPAVNPFPLLKAVDEVD
ncbi:MAG: M23 family metallopeptidase, partial [Actinomycetota bacterium]